MYHKQITFPYNSASELCNLFYYCACICTRSWQASEVTAVDAFEANWLYLGNGERYGLGYYWSLIVSCIPRVRLDENH